MITHLNFNVLLVYAESGQSPSPFARQHQGGHDSLGSIVVQCAARWWPVGQSIYYDVCGFEGFCLVGTLISLISVVFATVSGFEGLRS